MYAFNALLLLSSCALSVWGYSDAFRHLARRDDDLPARVPYVFPEPGTDALADSIRAHRPNNTLLDLDGVLLNSEPLAAAWDQTAVVIRQKNPLPGDMRELLYRAIHTDILQILRTAVVNSAAYQWIQHESPGREAGLTTAQLRTIRFTPTFSSLAKTKPTNATLTPALAAALDFADWTASSVYVPDDVYDGLKTAANLTDVQMIYASATAGFYAFVSRFTVGLDMDSKMRVAVPIPE
ncbi:AhpD-like protein [Amylostereum chailletii]|nr:AhpD-like protein [Amylostereum chailletii]